VPIKLNKIKENRFATYGGSSKVEIIKGEKTQFWGLERISTPPQTQGSWTGKRWYSRTIDFNKRLKELKNPQSKFSTLS